MADADELMPITKDLMRDIQQVRDSNAHRVAKTDIERFEIFKDYFSQTIGHLVDSIKDLEAENLLLKVALTEQGLHVKPKG